MVQGLCTGLQLSLRAVRIRFGPYNEFYPIGGLAQLVERLLCMHVAIGSIPLTSKLKLNSKMYARLLKDRRRRLLHSLYEPRRQRLKALIERAHLPSRLRGQAYRALLLLPRDSSSVRRRNRCALTGRSRAVYRRFGLSRLRFRSLARQGKLLGVKPAS